MAASPLAAFSHVSFSAPSETVYNQTLEFYLALGFQTVSRTGEPVAGVDKQVPSTWLHLHPSLSTSSLTGVTIHLTLREPASVGNEHFESEERFLQKVKERQQRLAEGDVRGIQITLVGQNMTVAESTLHNLNHPYVRRRPPTASSSAPLDLYTYDPVANLIRITTSTVPFTSEAPLTVPQSPPTLSATPLTPFRSLSQSRPKRLAFLTSGGDCSGMNACVRAVARCALARCCIPYAVLEGYQGLVDGGDKVKRVGWEDLRGIMPLGGTVIGSARCLPFRSRPGRLAACLNMVKLGIDALIVVGGDGSLTGADILRAEWAGLVEELAKEGKVTQEEATGVGAELKIVGLVGSIDNDMAMTDITIGANTSLHRICEALDSIVSTALSHQRAFVVEVMGRHCGWLALMAAIAVGADWVFLPERPPPMTSRYPDWESEMCALLQRNKEMGNRKALIIVCEGAIDQSLQPLKPEKVKEVIEKRLGLDTRVTTLGHIQRGGTPSAYDRFLATVQGARAVDAVLEANPTTMSPMIGMSENQVTSVPLMEAVKTTKEVANCVSRKDFAAAMDLRDPEFKHAYDAYIESTLLADAPLSNSVPATHRLRVGICHVGAPAGGMNAATRSAVRLLLNRGHTPLGFSNGFQGLVDGDVKTLNWQDVNGWTTRGGSELGTNRVQPAPLPGAAPTGKGSGGSGAEFLELGLLAYSFQKWGLQALLVIGGFEGFTSVLNLSRARALYPAFCIPIIHLPATVSNNVPGTDYSLGSDTALNAIVEACDRIKLSAAASRKRVFIVEVQGGECGYLATLGGLAAGATTSYIPEEGLNLARIQTDIQHLKRRYIEEDQRGIANEGRVILRNEAVGAKTYTTEQLANIIRDEAKGLFDARTAVLGHLQQGGVPSPLDRCRAVRLAVNCVDWLERVAFESLEKKLNGSNTDVNVDIPLASPMPRTASQAELARLTRSSPTTRSPTPRFASPTSDVGKATKRDSDDIKSTRRPNVYCPDSDTACVIGIRGAQVTYSPVESVAGETNLTKRKATMRPWWLELQGLTRLLAKYGYSEEVEADLPPELLDAKGFRKLDLLKYRGQA